MKIEIIYKITLKNKRMERERLLNMILFVHLAFHTEVFFWGGGVSKNLILVLCFDLNEMKTSHVLWTNMVINLHCVLTYKVIYLSYRRLCFHKMDIFLHWILKLIAFFSAANHVIDLATCNSAERSIYWPYHDALPYPAVS